MRFDTPVYFQHIESGEYNPQTGDYEADIVTEVKGFADVTDSATETLQFVYGEIRQGCLTIRLQQPYEKPINSVRVGDKVYRVDWTRRTLTGKSVLVVSEVQ